MSSSSLSTTGEGSHDLLGEEDGGENPIRRNMLQDLREKHTRPQLIPRTFVPETGSCNSGSLTVMQWNILAMALSEPEVSRFECEEGCLDWESRRALILEEMILREADLVTCQEMDDFGFFNDALAPLGYEGVFAAKPRSPCLKQTVNIGPDGSAIFFAKHRFVMLDSGSKVLLFHDTQKESNSIVAWVVLRDRTTNNEMTFVTTHLKSGTDEKFAAMREQQTLDLMKVIEQLAERTKNLVVCGDFNGDPSETFYSLLRSMESVKLESAYSQVLQAEPVYTTWKIRKDCDKEKKRCIDYVFYSREGKMRPLSVLGIPKDEDVGAVLRFPRLNFPSDHLDLIVRFALESSG